MIILGISLLRLGDLILQRPLIEGLRRKHPQSEIHLLVNKQFSQAEFLFEGWVDKFIYFDRESLQRSCGEKEYGILWGFHQLKGLISELNQTGYDYVYNFTHNRLSAHLAGLIQAQNRLGIYAFQGEFYGLTNPWIQFFNNFFGRPESGGFHYSELLAKSLDIQVNSRSHPAVNSGRKSEAGEKSFILIQPLTSDAKKNWNIQKYRSLVDALEKEFSDEVLILGAPFERETLAKVFAEKNIFICDLAQAQSVLKKARLLITGDTSIKHLAAALEVPILELSLGSSQPLQVGAYSHNAIILQPRVKCGPCPHSQPCSRPTHECGENLRVEPVLEAARLFLRKERPPWDPWDPFSHKYLELNVLKTEINDIVGWTVRCLSSAQRDHFEQIIQRKTMIIEELDRRQLSLVNSPSLKGVTYEQRTRKLPLGGAEAS